MMRKIGFIFTFLILAIFLVGSVSAANYCCEKTTSGAWCQNVNAESQCSIATNPITGEPFKRTTAFCDATSYCRVGTCVNLQEGTCLSNTPQIVCSGNYGFWSEKSKSQLEQCQLGCCLIGEQAAFTTQISCNRLSALYGLKINWQSSINDELTCLASASPKTEGACVFTKNYVKTCERTTREKCQNEIAKNSAYSNVEFHAGYLCTAQELGTICAKSTQTQCDDKDDVRFIDTCGNLANIYDSGKANDEAYWTKIQEPTCGDGKGNKNSKSCGECDYLAGSMCKRKKAGETTTYGDFICKDLDCKDYTGTYSGSFDYPHHGETWCTSDSKTNDKNVPGATYFKLMCYNGEVTKEECDSTRQKICAEVEDEESGFMYAACKANVWQDCTSQNNSEDCSDVDLRDCSWIAEDAGSGNNYYFSSSGMKNDGTFSGVCVPKYAPGFERTSKSDVSGGENCQLATAFCTVTYKKWWLASEEKWECTDNCYCLEDEWQNSLNSICTKLGDCGNKVNYIGKPGYEFDDVIKEEKLSD